jgi:hypothetical protein
MSNMCIINFNNELRALRCFTTEKSSAERDVMCEKVAKCKQNSFLTSMQNIYLFTIKLYQSSSENGKYMME